MKRSSEKGRAGYVTLLAITFAFGLATLGTALAVSARSYLSSAASRERAILDRISLESAAAITLSEIAIEGRRPLKPTRLTSVVMNGRSISRELSVPEDKVDPAMDNAAMLKAAVPFALKSGVSSMTALSEAAELSPANEDCLRRRLTFGRFPEPLAADLGVEEAAVLHLGDQVDLRLGLLERDRDHVLWVRARLSGSQGQWRLHDYRRLSGRFTTQCG